MQSLFDEDFDLWNDEKKKLNKAIRNVYAKPREIRYIKIGLNIGKEIFGKSGFFRPVLIISKIGNMYFATPLTTKGHNQKYYLPLSSVNFGKDSFVVINQGRMFDMQRFFTKIGIVSKEEFKHIKKLLAGMYFPEDF